MYDTSWPAGIFYYGGFRFSEVLSRIEVSYKITYRFIERPV